MEPMVSPDTTMGADTKAILDESAGVPRTIPCSSTAPGGDVLNERARKVASSSLLYPVDPAKRKPSLDVERKPADSKNTAARSQSIMSGTAWATLAAIS